MKVPKYIQRQAEFLGVEVLSYRYSSYEESTVAEVEINGEVVWVSFEGEPRKWYGSCYYFPDISVEEPYQHRTMTFAQAVLSAYQYFHLYCPDNYSSKAIKALTKGAKRGHPKNT